MLEPTTREKNRIIVFIEGIVPTEAERVLAKKHDTDGYSIISTYTSDGVHPNEAGQDIMGTDVGAAQSVIFG